MLPDCWTWLLQYCPWIGLSMLASRLLSRRPAAIKRTLPVASDYICPACQRARSRFSTTAPHSKQTSSPFRTRLRIALANTRIQWKPIPVGLGIAFLGAVQFYRVQERQRRKKEEQDEIDEEQHREGESKGRPKKRKRIRPSGPWYIEPPSLQRP